MAVPPAEPDPPRSQVVVMGISGAGKTSVGRALAARLAVDFVDGDDLHAPASVAKMARGEPLVDDDRWPWLDRVGATLVDAAAHPVGVVVACSALRRVYRDRIRAAAPGVHFVFLDGAVPLITARQAARKGHFMPPTLMESQVRTLERPDGEPGVVAAAIEADVETIAKEAAAALAASARGKSSGEKVSSTMAQADIGVVGLAVMGRNLALNMAEKGFRVAVHNRSPERIDETLVQAGPLAANLVACRTPEDLVAALAPPRSVLLMVKAGKPFDDTLAALLPLLSPGDTVIDAGNTNWTDTERRQAALAGSGIRLLGIGVSGGEEGARHGPSIMAGGDRTAFEPIAPILTAIAARYQGTPCAAYMGPGGAGNFVKTIHNGIEYADMAMIAEVYGLMRDGLGMAPAAAAAVFERWNGGRLASYLIEITGTVLGVVDPATGRPLVEVIVDSAGQKGTGRWSAIEAIQLGVPAPSIGAAVDGRVVSALSGLRQRIVARHGADLSPGAAPLGVDDLEAALLAAKIAAYAQGFAILATASAERGWALPLAEIARIWRAGCIIRSAFLDTIAAAYEADPALPSLLVDPALAAMFESALPALRRVVAHAAVTGLPAPALSAALSWFDSLRRLRTTADLLQAQRDFFGAHGFARVDAPGEHHGPWSNAVG